MAYVVARSSSATGRGPLQEAHEMPWQAPTPGAPPQAPPSTPYQFQPLNATQEPAAPIPPAAPSPTAPPPPPAATPPPSPPPAVSTPAIAGLQTAFKQLRGPEPGWANDDFGKYTDDNLGNRNPGQPVTTLMEVVRRMGRAY